MARRISNSIGRPIGARGASPGLSTRAAYGQRIILGIDPGLDRTGYAVIKMPAARVLDAGIIRSSPDSPLAPRLVEINDGIQEVLSDHRVNLVAVEDLFAHYAHPRTAILMGHARGVVLLAAARRGIELVSILPTKIKKTLTGNGHASKQQMQRAVMATLRLQKPPEPPDVADALAIAWCAATIYQSPSGHPKHGGQIRAAPVRKRRAALTYVSPFAPTQAQEEDADGSKTGRFQSVCLAPKGSVAFREPLS
jgi:crossover junction endodeoxyribonuclease RuvC